MHITNMRDMLKPTARELKTGADWAEAEAAGWGAAGRMWSDQRFIELRKISTTPMREQIHMAAMMVSALGTKSESTYRTTSESRALSTSHAAWSAQTDHCVPSFSDLVQRARIAETARLVGQSDKMLERHRQKRETDAAQGEGPQD